LDVDVCRSIAVYKREHGVPMMQPHRIGVVQQRAARFAEANGDVWRTAEISNDIRGELRAVLNNYLTHLLGHRPRMQEYVR
jgi:hypothetical protein